MTPAIAGALVVLAASFALSVAFVLANGGLDLPAAQRPPASAGALSGSPGASTVAEASVAPAESAVAKASVAPAETGAISPTPSSNGTPETPAPSLATSRPRPTATPQASSSRYDLLTACPDALDCWVYIIRQGDNLFSIAKYFGVPLNVVQDRNPWTATTPLAAGQKLLLPTPTR